MIYYRRSFIEEQIISVCAFFRPLTIWKRFYCVQMLSICYLIINLFLMIIINCCPWFPGLTKIDSNWHYYQRLDTKFLANLFYFNKTIIINENLQYFNDENFIHYNNSLTPNNSMTITPEMKPNSTTTMATPNSGLLSLNKRDIETNEFNFNINQPEISLDSIDYIGEMENETMINNNDLVTTTTKIFINETANNDFDYSEDNLPLEIQPLIPNTLPPTMNKTDEDNNFNNGTTPPNPFIVSTLSIMNIDWTQWLFYYIDFLFQLLNIISLILIKTFHLSISLLIILKCWQLYREIIVHQKQFNRLNSINNDQLTKHCWKQIQINIKKIFLKFNQKNLTKTETERLILLTRLLKKNIQCYENIWLSMLIIWIVLAGVSLLTLLQFYQCNSNEINNFNNTILNNEHEHLVKLNNWPNNLKTILKWLIIAVHLQDLFLLIGFYGLIKFILKRCICLTNCL